MNYHFLELQAREKMERYRSEGMSSQALARSLVNRKPFFSSFRLLASRLLLIRHPSAPVTQEITDNPELKNQVA